MRRRLSPTVIDTGIALVLAGLSVTTLVNLPEDVLENYRRGPDLWAHALVLAQTVPLALRRRNPVAVLAVVASAFMVDRFLDYPSTIATTAPAFALHAIGSELPPGRSARMGYGVAGLLVAFTMVGVGYSESVGWDTLVTMAIFTMVPVKLGREVHERRRQLVELEERAQRAEQEREERARRAVAEERARIARELHDVVAHQMAVMTLQAEGARRLADGADPRVATALDTIRQAGHDALTELRRMVGLLRTVEDDDGAGPDLEPQPGLDRLPALVAQMEEAGLQITVETRGEPRPLPPGVDLSAYRILQESLTNVLKHAGPHARAQVRVGFEEEVLTVEVVDDGQGAARSLSPPQEGGHGLVGMQERVALLHGELRVGPRSGGGFEVRARLPLGAT